MSENIYVFKCPGRISQSAAEKLKKSAEEALGASAIVFVLGEGMTLEVIQNKRQE